MNTSHSDSELDDNKPLDSFVDCHAGIISKLQNFGELATLLEPAARARRLATETMEFFHSAVFAHHKDEEKELFPLVLAHAEPGEEHQRVQRYVDQLVAEHRHIEAMWRKLEPDLEKIAKGHDSKLSADDITLLVKSYQAHAMLEEAEFLPLSQKILGRDNASMAELGLSLHIRHAVRAARRGLLGS